MSEPLLALRHVSKSARDGERTVDILRDVSVAIDEGEHVALAGPSGSGKSTMLHLLGFLTPPTAGEVLFRGRAVNYRSRADVIATRHAVGFVFQDAKLLPRLTVMENVCVPLVHRGVPPREQKGMAAAVLEEVGLGHRMTHRPSQLSGGEQMRAAIARALVTRPRIILADEPTGSLDSANGARIADLLFGISTGRHTLVMVTHHEPLANRCDRIVRIGDGAVVATETTRGLEAGV